MMVVLLDGSSVATIWRDVRRCITVSLPPPLRRKRVSELLPMRPLRDSLRVEVRLLVPDCPILAEPLCDAPVPPVPLLAAVPPLAPAFDWPEFCADDGAARASAATVARVRVKVLIWAS